MISGDSGSGDERNVGFGAPENIADQAAGFDFTHVKQESEGGKDHRRRPGDPKDIPQDSLAVRLKRSTKGDG
jgi:hypothetical protein